MSAAPSQSQTVPLPPRSHWSVKQAGRGRKLKSGREREMEAVEGGREGRKKVVLRSGEREREQKESPDKSLC